MDVCGQILTAFFILLNNKIHIIHAPNIIDSKNVFDIILTSGKSNARDKDADVGGAHSINFNRTQQILINK